jgi:hypothetical protein
MSRRPIITRLDDATAAHGLTYIVRVDPLLVRVVAAIVIGALIALPVFLSH